jgi:phage FluMu protein Com
MNLIFCKFCGNLLFKSESAVAGILDITIKCPLCGKILKLPDDETIVKEKDKHKNSRPGLD